MNNNEMWAMLSVFRREYFIIRVEESRFKIDFNKRYAHLVGIIWQKKDRILNDKVINVYEHLNWIII